MGWGLDCVNTDADILIYNRCSFNRFSAWGYGIGNVIFFLWIVRDDGSAWDLAFNGLVLFLDILHDRLGFRLGEFPELSQHDH